MKKKLPPIKPLSDSIRSRRLSGSQRVADAEAYLVRHATALERFNDVEHFVTSEPPLPNQDVLERHFLNARMALARELWARELFIGVSVIDELLFLAIAREKTSEPIRYALEFIRDKGLHRPGLIVYPVHSFGLVAAGYLHWKSSARMHYIAPQYGLALAAQSNSFEGTLSFLELAREQFGVAKPISSSLLEHWYRSRSTKWLTKNPLLVARVQSFPGAYYENQFLLLSKLRACTAFAFMLSALQHEFERDKERPYSWGSQAVNNWQTLDIHHYIVWYNGRGKYLHGDCVPMSVDPTTLAELCNLNVVLSPEYWMENHEPVDALWTALTTVHVGYLKRSFTSKPTAHGRIFRKVFGSLRHFQRSFARDRHEGENCVSLATAFEMLLSDSYCTGIRKRLVRRASLLLDGEPEADKLVESTENIYFARSEFVHKGEVSATPDMNTARRAYTRCFTSLAQRLSRINPSAKDIIADLLGDTTDDSVEAPEAG